VSATLRVAAELVARLNVSRTCSNVVRRSRQPLRRAAKFIIQLRAAVVDVWGKYFKIKSPFLKAFLQGFSGSFKWSLWVAFHVILFTQVHIKYAAFIYGYYICRYLARSGDSMFIMKSQIVPGSIRLAPDSVQYSAPTNRSGLSPNSVAGGLRAAYTRPLIHTGVVVTETVWEWLWRNSDRILAIIVGLKLAEVTWREWSPTLRDIYSHLVDLFKMRPRYKPETMRSIFMNVPLTQSRVTPNHTHGEAAGDRGAAVSTMVRIANMTGSSYYFIQKSRTDERKGRAGSRSYYWTKDLNVSPAVMVLPENPMMILVDVDQYLDMPLILSSHNVPFLLYTFQPSRVSRESSNYVYTFDDNDQVEYRVTGGATYVHKVWNYSRDHILATSTFCGIPYRAAAYLVDRRATDADHQLVCLTPQGSWGMFSAWLTLFLSGDRLCYLRVAYEGFLRLKVLTNAGLFTSTGKVGCYHNSYISTAADDAIASIARVSKYDLTNPQAASFVDGDKLATAALVEYHRVKAGHKPDYIFPVDQGVRRYQFAPETFDPEAKAGMVPFMSPIVHGAFVPDKVLSNEQECIRARITNVQPPVLVSTPFMAQVIEEFAKCLIPEPHKLHPTDFEEVVERQARPSQRRILAAAEYVIPERMLKIFLKKEAYPDVKPPRPISQINGPDKRDYSMFIYAFEAVIKPQPWYAFSRPPREIAQRVAAVVDKANFAVNSDFSKWDGHVSNLLRELEQTCLLRAFAPQHHAKLVELFQSQFDLSAIGTYGSWYKSGFARASGSPETSILNSMDNAFVAFMAFRMTKEKGIFIAPEEAYARLGIYGGDDGLTANIDPKIYVSAAKSVGQELAAEQVWRGKLGIKFLARMYSPHVWFGDLNSVSDLPRQLSKFHVTVALSPTITPVQKLVEKARAFALMDANTPLLGDLCRKAVSLGIGISTPDEIKRIQPWFSQFELSVQYPNEPADWYRDYVVSSLPEFDSKRFLRWLEDCKTVDDLLSPPLCQEPKPAKPAAPVVVDSEIVLPVVPTGPLEEKPHVPAGARVKETPQQCKERKQAQGTWVEKPEKKESFEEMRKRKIANGTWVEREQRQRDERPKTKDKWRARRQ